MINIKGQAWLFERWIMPSTGYMLFIIQEIHVHVAWFSLLRDLSGGYCYPVLNHLGPVVCTGICVCSIYVCIILTLNYYFIPTPSL